MRDADEVSACLFLSLHTSFLNHLGMISREQFKVNKHTFNCMHLEGIQELWTVNM